MKSLLAAAVVVLCALPAHAAVSSYALVIGYNAPPDGMKDLETLRYADDDALRYAMHFESFTEKTWLLSVLDDETQLQNPHAADGTQVPTWKAIDSVIADVRKRIAAAKERGDDAVFYLAYSGHGAKDQKGNYFLTLKDGGITQQSLYERIVANVPAKYHHLIIDACHAEAIVGARGAQGGMFDKEKTAKVKAIEPQSFTQGSYRERFQSVGTIVGTTADSETHEWSKIRAGVFTHAVLSALSGAADVNTDGRVEYSELHAFVAAATRTFTDPRNRPRVVALPPKVNMHAPLLDRPASAQKGSILSGMASALGHFFIELSNGRRLLDCNVAGDLPLRLWLPNGTRAFVRTDDMEAEIEARSEGETRFADLRLRPRAQTARGSLEADYRQALFAAPFGVSYYRGFVDSAGVASVDFERAAPVVEAPAPVLSKKPVLAATQWPAPPPKLVEKPAQQITWNARKSGSVASFVLAAAFTGLAIGSGIAMGQAETEFNTTTIQIQAKRAADAFAAWQAMTAIASVLAGSGYIIGFSVWPYGRSAAEPATTAPPAAIGAEVSVRGSF